MGKKFSFRNLKLKILKSLQYHPIIFTSICARREEEGKWGTLGLTSQSDYLPPHPKLAALPMSSPPLPGHSTTLTLPATGASACLLRPRARKLLLRGLPRAAAPPGLACSHHSSVAAAPSTSPQCAGGGGGLVALAVTASAVAVSACFVFFSAIRSMLACKREAEFLEKHFHSLREKLPETMASLRLVGREVGDLAADLSDLSQELTKGVKSSLSIIHTADAKLRQPTPSALPVPGCLIRRTWQRNRRCWLAP
ncbi:unnamed protein product [Urochloa decumbens]|uniref:Uncharacterized protein n=1 Tax=Urochloa decumbens TaxID=240449 RepID=A0ABC9DS74_9POAL